MDAKAIAEVLSALAAVAWPTLAALAVWKMFPFAKELFDRDKIKIKIGELELTAEEATETISVQIKDLQAKVVQLESRIAAKEDKNDHVTINSIEYSNIARGKILWVDDMPTNNAIQIDLLQNNGYEVILANSTEDGIKKFENSKNFDLIITDMGRSEKKKYIPDAGVFFVQEMRKRKVSVPIIVFSTRASIEKFGKDARRAGASALTNSPVDLYSLIQNFLKK